MRTRVSVRLCIGALATSLVVTGCHPGGGAGAVESDAEALDAVVSADAGLTTNVVTLAAGQIGPFSLLLNGGYIFWATANGSVLDVAKHITDAGLAVTLASSQGTIGALASNGTQLYWTNTASGTIETIPIGGDLPAHVVSGQANPTGIAVDATNIYWTTSGATGAVFKAPIGGLDGAAPTMLASGQDAPQNLLSSGDRLFWSTPSTVVTLSTAGGKATVLTSGQAMIASIAVDTANVYFTTSTALMSIPIGGGTPVTLVGNLPSPSGVATDGTSVYFLTDGDPTSVMSVPIAGGATTLIDRAGPPMNAPLAIAVDTTSVYWTVNNSTGEFNGLLEKAPK